MAAWKCAPGNEKYTLNYQMLKLNMCKKNKSASLQISDIEKSKKPTPENYH
jgi:hypothetical protein